MILLKGHGHNGLDTGDYPYVHDIDHQIQQ
jgi:hypothetical protein